MEGPVARPVERPLARPVERPLERPAAVQPRRSAPAVSPMSRASAVETDPISTVPPAAPQLPMAGTARLIRIALALAAVVVVGAGIYRLAADDSERATDAPASEQPAPEPSTASERPAPDPAAAADPTAMPTQPDLAPAPRADAPREPAAAAPTAEPQPAPAEGDVKAQVQALVDEAHSLEQQGKPRQALQLYEQAIAIDPNDSTVLARLAFGYLNRGENEQASDYASRAVAVDPASSEGWIVLGAARHALGDKAGARDAYRKCVEVGRGPYVDECRRVAR
jgi:tetratricopeptide (TPR) repeat protein